MKHTYNMRAIINLLIVIEILLLPLPILAAPSIKQTASGAILSRDLSPHMNCYGGGEQFQNLADWSNVNATVKGGCDTFATYNGHLFGVGDQVRHFLAFPDILNTQIDLSC